MPKRLRNDSLKTCNDTTEVWPKQVYEPDVFDIHVSLLHPSFGEFSDKIRNDDITFDWSDCDAALAICSKMCSIFENKNLRLEEFLPILAKYLGVDELPAVHFPTFQNDAGLVVKIGESTENAVIITVDCKNELGVAGASSPHEQENFVCFLHAVNKFRTAARRGVFPVILLSLCGPYLSVSLAAFGSSASSDPITPFLPLLITPHDRGSMEQVAKCLRAVKDCVRDLTAYYLHPDFPSIDLTPEESQQLAYPYVREVFIGSFMVRFDYVNEVATGKLVFMVVATSITQSADSDATTTSPLAVGDQFLVKFTKTYCEEAHKLCASIGAAPALFSVSDRLPGGWFVVAMEWLGRNTYALTEGYPLQAKVRAAVKILHDADYVHGDLRPANIRVVVKAGQTSREHRVCLVDFDWSGKEGVTRYPSFMNRQDVDWHETAHDFAPLRKEHDNWFLDRLYAEC
jgi:hypothetical protein